ncbi:MAG: sel1 repeat family protein [Bacteroidaceae bacterium]|nr:sel1 repeat family protein [Bacteroidaceae bacterium]MCF0186046.1 sel1 repeat family protein [Bacteroidaceae bacterium]
MALLFEIDTTHKFNIQEFTDFLGIDGLVMNKTTNIEHQTCYLLHRPDYSTTSFVIEECEGKKINLLMDPLSSYEDYKLLPYLLDSLSQYLNGEPYVIYPDTDKQEEFPAQTAFQFFNEEWAQAQIGEAVAFAKCAMSLHLPFFFELPIDHYYFITESELNACGVDLHSSTSRIYGYMQYLLRNHKLPYNDDHNPIGDEEEVMSDGEDQSVEVPEHISIGTVQSWQTDGCITTESFCAQDVSLLINIGQRYLSGAKVDGVVLNDLGTVFQEGIGIDKNVDVAISWYVEALRNGDHRYAPSNIGDIYRKGWSSQGIQLDKAFEAYRESDDPYAHFRIGQAFEEGWVDKPNLEQAMFWYNKAASQGHHLALKRLKDGHL